MNISTISYIEFTLNNSFERNLNSFLVEFKTKEISAPLICDKEELSLSDRGDKATTGNSKRLSVPRTKRNACANEPNAKLVTFCKQKSEVFDENFAFKPLLAQIIYASRA